MAQGVSVEGLGMDEETLIDLEYSEEEKTKAIIEEIIAQAEEEMWRYYEEEVEAEEEEACVMMSGKASRLTMDCKDVFKFTGGSSMSELKRTEKWLSHQNGKISDGTTMDSTMSY